ncbi:MAG: hypothetical protein H2049_09205 [Porphyrobacter sp.]|nr:hypothetical protein [Porphyrobacter sp.]
MFIVLATEDELSEAVSLRLIAHAFGNDVEVQALGRKGNGYLRSKLGNFIEIAQRYPVLLLTDLDALPCAGELVTDWINGRVLPDNLLLRVAVRETESWLLADRDNFAQFLGVGFNKIPQDPEALPDPKAHLYTIARRAQKSVRAELIIQRGANASRGIGYNRLLSDYVRTAWDFESAAERSQSLRRTVNRLAELAERIRY